MVKRVRALIVKYWDVLSYLFFGGLTTAVDYLVSNLLFYLLKWEGWTSALAGWIAAVAFAYLTNKPFVFKSHDWSAKTVLPELARFVGSRIGTGLLQIAFIAVTVDWLQGDMFWMKAVISVVVVILNYFASKLLVFQKK